MIKDTKYIIKRIIIGVGIALVLSFLTACKVSAKNVNLANVGNNISTYYAGASSIGSQTISYNTNLISIGGIDFQYYSDGVSRLNFDYTYRLEINIPKSYVTGSNNLAITIGLDNGYFNDAKFFQYTGQSNTIGWLPCTPISLPGVASGRGSASFTTFICPISDELNESITGDTAKFYFVSNSVALESAPGENPSTGYTATTTTFYTRYDIVLYNNSESLIYNELQETNDAINSDDVTDADSTASSFFDDFSSDTHGLTGIITAPLSMIQSITSSSCSPLILPLPFVNKNLTLPCMSTIYSQYFGSFFSMYQIITFGIISYWVCVKIFALVKGFKDPNDDRIEVLDL